MKLCEGKVAVVTGAGGGLGRAHALMLARHGAKVIVNDFGSSKSGNGQDNKVAERVVEEIRESGGEAEANTADVSNWDQAGEMIDQAVNAFGRLDILVNNAGILRDKMLWNLTESDFDQVVKVNLKGTFAPLHHAANYWRLQFKEKGLPVNGRVINTTSSSGLFGNIGQCNYSPAKSGVAAMTITAALELKRMGITVNAIAPRAETRMTSGLNELSEEQERRRHPDYVASLVAWLAGDEAADVTGRFFEAWGWGYSVIEGARHGAHCEATMTDPAGLTESVHRIVAESALPCHFNRGKFHDL